MVSPNTFTVPECLMEMLLSSDTYTVGLDWPNIQRDQTLLISCDLNLYGAMYERLSLDEYSDRVRAVYMGHSAEFLKGLYAAMEAFDELTSSPDKLSDRMIFMTRIQLSLLKKAKVARYDALYISRLLELFTERRKLRLERLTMYPITGTAGALVICTAMANLRRFGTWTVYGVAATVLSWGAFKSLKRLEPGIQRGMNEGASHRKRENATAILLLPFVGIVLGLFDINNLFERIVEICGDYSTVELPLIADGVLVKEADEEFFSRTRKSSAR